MTRIAIARERLRQAYAPAPIGRRWWVVAVATAVASAIVAFLRIEPGTRSQLWAEDGWIFLEHAYAGGGGLLEPYRGYAHLLPRAAALVVHELVPMQLVGAAMSVVASIVIGIVTGIVLLAARTRTGALPAVLAAAGVALLPLGSMEVAGNVANSHWYLMAAAFWVLISRPAGRAWSVVTVVAVAVAALSDPLTGLLLPAALARGLAGRWRPRVDAIAFAVAIGVQAAIVLVSERVRDDAGMPDLRELLALYVVRVGFGTVAGGLPGNAVAAMLGPTLTGAVGAVVLAGLAFLAVRAGRSTLLPGLALVTSLAYWFLIHVVNWPRTLTVGDETVSWAARYSVNALLLVGASLVLLLDRAMAHVRRTRSGIASGVLACAVAAATLWSGVAAFQSPIPRNPTVDLGGAVDAAVAACLEADDPSMVIALPVDPAEFALDVTCAAIEAHAR